MVKEEIFKCPVCGKEFTTIYEIRGHLISSGDREHEKYRETYKGRLMDGVIRITPQEEGEDQTNEDTIDTAIDNDGVVDTGEEVTEEVIINDTQTPEEYTDDDLDKKLNEVRSFTTRISNIEQVQTELSKSVTNLEQTVDSLKESIKILEKRVEKLRAAVIQILDALGGGGQ